MERLEQRLVKVIAECLDVNPEQVVPEAGFVHDLGADSLEVVDLIVGIEEEFEILIPDQDAHQIRTVREALEYLNQRLLKPA
jgi:acyl carrier protein